MPGCKWRTKTPEEVAYLDSVIGAIPDAGIAAEFAERFGWDYPAEAIGQYRRRQGIRNPPRYSDEFCEWFKGFRPTHTWREVGAAAKERFGYDITKNQVGSLARRLGVSSEGNAGCWKPGRVSETKGKTWDELGYSKELQDRMRAGQFKKGNMPHNALYVGAERVTKDGYVEVCIAPRPINKRTRHDNWVPKAWLVWEKAHGCKVPANSKIIFADRDKRNFDPENLVCVPNRLWPWIMQNHVEYCDKATLQLAMKAAECAGAANAAINSVREKRK